MAGSPKKRERKQRVDEVTGDPAWFAELCAYVSEGGTVLEFCKRSSVSYAHVSNWIAAEDHRRKKFEAAMKMRGEYLQEMVYRNLRTFADVDLAKAYDEAGNLLPVHKMPEEIRRAIAAIEVEELFGGRGANREHIGYTRKIKTVSPEKAVELLAKVQRMLVDKVEHTGKVTLADLLSDDEEKPTA